MQCRKIMNSKYLDVNSYNIIDQEKVINTDQHTDRLMYEMDQYLLDPSSRPDIFKDVMNTLRDQKCYGSRIIAGLSDNL